MQKKIYAILLTSLISGRVAFAFDPFVIESVRLEGLSRISAGTVYNYLPVESGDLVSEEDTSSIIKSLYKTGFFSHIALGRDGDVLVVELEERASIGKIKFRGNKSINTDDLLKGLREVGLQEGRTYQPATVKLMTQTLLRQYYNFGKYAVSIESDVSENDKGQVDIVIDIYEGKAAKIKDINFVGNQVYSNRTLLSEMQLSTPGMFSWFTKSDQYVKSKLAGDQETLRSFYLDRGYLNFDMASTQVAITPDKESIYLTLNMSEGDKFSINDIDIVGDTVVSKEELLSLLSLKMGDVYSQREIIEAAQTISDRLGEDGYAFAEVIPEPEALPGDAHLVNMHFKVQAGQRYYARQVRFEGNAKTQDIVLRREMVQLEGAWVSNKWIQAGQTNLNRTGHFKNVQVDIEPVAGAPDQLDIVYTVEETSSGQLTGGIGYSDVDGLLFQFSVSNRNFLGTGNNVDFNFNNSTAATNYSVGYYDPYYTIDGISRGFNFYYNETNLSKTTSISSYTTDTYGANVNFGFPVSDHSRFDVGIGYQGTKLVVQESSAPAEILGFTSANDKEISEFTLSLGWRKNELDRYLFPRSGYQVGFTGMLAVPGSDLTYYRLTADAQMYTPLPHNFVASLSARSGFGDGYSSTESLPFYKHFFLGGARSVRGYGENSLGPKDSNGNPFGGTVFASTTAALHLPNPFVEGDSSVRASLFVDAGQVYNHNDTYTNNLGANVAINNPNGVRAGAGFALTWMSPLAPLVFSVAKPVNKQSGDESQIFTFSFGTFF